MGRTGCSAQPGWACAATHVGSGSRRSQEGLTALKIDDFLLAIAATVCSGRRARPRRIEPAGCPAIRRGRLSVAPISVMNLVSIPANPVPEDVVSGTLKTRDGVDAALRALGAAAGPQGHGLPVPGPRRVHREIFRDRARPARPRLRGRDARLARAGAVRPRAARSAQGLRRRFLRIPDRSRNLHQRGRAAGLSAAASSRSRIRWARRCCCAPRYHGQPLVRPHGAARRR